MNILLVGEESAGIQMLRLLGQSGHRIVAVMASPTKNNGTANLWSIAEKLGHETWPAKLVKDPALADEIRAREVDILLNVHSLFVINGEVLSAPRIGSFNIHPGPLPRYAGLNAPSWAIYRGESSHGVTVHKMVPGIDAGPVAYQALFDIEETDTGLSLSSKCVKAGIPLLSRLLESASLGAQAIPLIDQDMTKREYFGREVPNDGRIIWSSLAREVLDFIRACDYLPFRSPWGHPRASWKGQEIFPLKAARTGIRCDCQPGTVGESVESGVRVACADEWITVKSVKLGDVTSQAADVLRPGDQLSDGLPRLQP
jgi:methionyl-tRNA formyltransferase